MAKKKEDGFRLILYQSTIGPNNIASKLFPLAKNFIIFFGAVTLIHFRGQELALLPPIWFESQWNGDLETAWLGYLFKLILHLILGD